uniref:Uncharacterized protein n=1 Tax=viral metagenome TaxID=1070528 RepID=A0A6H2A1K2_9ZZZZ
MFWQDWVISIIGWVFGIALLPSVLGKNKPAKSSCLLTGVGLLIMGITMATMSLWMSFASNMLCGSLWLAMLFQRRII